MDPADLTIKKSESAQRSISLSFPSKERGIEKADHLNHIGLGISLIVTKEIFPIIRE